MHPGVALAHSCRKIRVPLGGVEIDEIDGCRGSSDRRLRAGHSSVEPGIVSEELHVDVEADELTTITWSLVGDSSRQDAHDYSR
jgi:hypothetical protein